MADPQDLVTAPAATAFLAAGGVTLTAAQAAALPALITSASLTVARYCGRWFAVSTYDEVKAPYLAAPDSGQPDWVDLSYMPVVPNSLTRVAGGRTAALKVYNADTATNQRATVEVVVSGDPDISLLPVGLKLNRTANGVSSSTSLLFADFPTFTGFAAAVIGLGNGWTAEVLNSSTMGPWPTADLVGVTSRTSATPSSPATLSVFADDLSDAPVNYALGHVLLPAGRGGRYADDWFGYPGTPGDDTLYGASGYRSAIRVTYRAGFAVIPPDLQQACTELVQIGLHRLATDYSLKSETAKDYSYTLRDLIPAMTPSALKTLNSYKLA